MKTKLRRILNLLLYLSFCAMLGTGLLLAFRLVPGSRGGRGLEALGWDRHQWGDLHTWLSYAFAILLVAHLVLAWVWLKKVAAKGQLWRLVAGFAVGLAIIFGIVLLPVSQRDDKPRHGRSATDDTRPVVEGDSAAAPDESSEAGRGNRERLRRQRRGAGKDRSQSNE